MISVAVIDSLYNDSAPVLGIYYAINILSLWIIFAMFRQGINKLAPKVDIPSCHSTDVIIDPAPLLQ